MSDLYKSISSNFQASGKLGTSESADDSSSPSSASNIINSITNITSTNVPSREDETFFTPVARTLISFFNASKEVTPKVQQTMDDGFKSAAKGFVDTVNVVSVRNNYKKSMEMLDQAPPALVVGAATLLPIVLFKKVPSVKDPALAVLGFSVSMYYCYPELVSKASKRVVEFYKQQTANRQLIESVTINPPPALDKPLSDKQ
ncbi:hypothetical protein SAMD00019534_078780 [Acytostelium subglobosum LB1]|uniref:hypothetical protein n=1 Tax=Acytostelium subglobosum LB1 TaxID=1410327 RepID=UPI000644DFC2|nr:hypothetical protein SAMD00019534_078780 [Acytostelium subglobosum LB1]GAM24703.1 hypothetical protein SAMD00019534_078780 [Acytostelium subglobosum LB1]|eukprot:XP_012752372.1 hypothetical protein SAMD00019534_078780 [Acytostelium subglobosum LB1]